MGTYRCRQPEYAGRFRCDGRVCNAQCCRGWNVQVDGRAMERFRRAPAALRREILAHLGKNEALGTPEIVRDGDACPFLAADLLCSLQKRCGEDFLADVCAEYPRRTTQFPDLLERALCMTCPVAAREALLDREPMRFEEVLLATGREAYFQQADDAEAIEGLHFFDLQRAGIRILQARERELSDRAAALQALFAAAQALLDAGRGEEIPALAARADAAAAKAAPFAVRLPHLLRLLADVTEAVGDDMPETGELQALLSRVLLPAGETEERRKARWEGLYAAYRRAVLARYGHILENYFVNEYFTALYPCALAGDFCQNGRVFAALLGLAETILACRLAAKGSAEEADVLSCLRWLAVRTTHFPGYMERLSACLAARDGV